MNPNRISLRDRLLNKWFLDALKVCRDNVSQLSAYDKELYTKLQDGYNLVGADMTITRKQLNHIKGVAADLLAGEYSKGTY